MTCSLSLYSAATGIFSGTHVSCPIVDINANVPDGCGCIVGHYDPLSQRVDLVTGLVVDYQPPPPSANHTWNAATKRWVYIKTDADVAAEVRARRDKIITACDWVTVRAMDEGTAAPANWLAYRSALRDITKQAGFPRTIAWPVAPA